MVTEVARPTFEPRFEVPAEVVREPSYGASKNPSMVCPRCESRLLLSYGEPQCMPCGYVDYSYDPPQPTEAETSILSTATRHVLRYVGDFPTLTETLAHVKLRRVRNRVEFGVKCPFCEREMAQSSLSGKRREIREERYRCQDGHRVSLTPGRNGALGWK